MNTSSFSSAADAETSDRLDWSGDRFYDRTGRSMSIGEWKLLHSDPEYAVIGDWRGDHGSSVRTFWTGVDVNYGYSESLAFETQYKFGNEASFIFHATEADARAGHDHMVRQITGDDEVACTDAPATSPSPNNAPATAPPAQPSRFFDRAGKPITMAQWARLRRDPNYCIIDGWLGEGGAHVEVYWFGLDLSRGMDARPVKFGLCVAAFENCPEPDTTYRFITEERALDHFQRIVPMVEHGIRPWHDREVEAAGFAPLPHLTPP